MRLADEPGTSGEVTVAADPARIWPVVNDIALCARHSPELYRVQWQSEITSPEVGARFTGFNRNEFMGEWETTSEVVELDPERVFGWAVLDGRTKLGELRNSVDAPISRWRFDLTPVAAGTRVRLSMNLGAGVSGLTLFVRKYPEREEQLVDGRLAALRDGIEQTLSGVVAELAEPPATAGS